MNKQRLKSGEAITRSIRVVPSPPAGYYRVIGYGYRVVAVYADGCVWNLRLGKWYKLEKDRDGYLTVHWCKVHRLVLLAFVGKPPSIHSIARHLDGNPANNQRSNLRWGTGKQNWQDRKKHGRVNAKAKWRGAGGKKLRSQHSASLRAAWQRPQAKRKWLAARKKTAKSLVYRRRLSVAMKIVKNKPASRRHASAVMKKRWADPTFREKMKKALNRPATHHQRVAAQLRRWKARKEHQ